MPALAADWCCGDGATKASSYTESTLTKSHSFNRSAVETTKQNHVDKGVRYLNGSSPAVNGLVDDIPPPKVFLFDSSKLRLQWPNHRPVGAGLTNLGNTCFLNSVLQCLAYTVPLAHHLTIDEHKRMCKVKDFCMLCLLQDHLSKSFRGGQSFKPLQVLQNLRNIAKSLTWGQQEDAHEFLRYVVDSMQKSCLAGTNGLDKYSKETTFVYQVFSGYLRSQVKCLRCMHASNTYDPFLDLSVDLKEVASIEQALHKFVSPEKLDIENAYKCERCKVRVPAQKRFTVHRTPNVLTIHLKRFDMSRPLGSKISRHIKFPVQMNIRPYMSVAQGEQVNYELYGVLVHSGFSCTSGHYYCYIKAPNRNWYCMNDSTVTQSTLNTVLGAEAYILFYVRTGKSSFSKGSKPHTITQPVQQNGSGDHQTVKIIGPQPPSAQMCKSNANVLQSHNSNTASTSNSLSSTSADSSYIKFNGIKLKLASNSFGAKTNQETKNKNVAKVLVPSLVPYAELSEEEDDSKTLQIDEGRYEKVKVVSSSSSKTSAVERTKSIEKSSTSSNVFHFKPRSLLKPAVSTSTSKLQDTTTIVEKSMAPTQNPFGVPSHPNGKETVSTAREILGADSSSTAGPDLPAVHKTECNSVHSSSDISTVAKAGQNGVHSSSDMSAVAKAGQNGFTKPAPKDEPGAEHHPPSAQVSEKSKQSSSRHSSSSPQRHGRSSTSQHRHKHSRTSKIYRRSESSNYTKHSSRRHSNSPSRASEHSRSTHRHLGHRHRRSRSSSPRRYKDSRSRSPQRARVYYRSRSPLRSPNRSRRSSSRSLRRHRRSSSPHDSRGSRPRHVSSRYDRSSYKYRRSPSPTRYHRRHRSRSRSPVRRSKSSHRSRSRSSHRSRHHRSSRSRSLSTSERNRHSTSHKLQGNSHRYGSPRRSSSNVVSAVENDDDKRHVHYVNGGDTKSNDGQRERCWGNGDHSYSSLKPITHTNGGDHKQHKPHHRVYKDEMKQPLLSNMSDNEEDEWVEASKPHHHIDTHKENKGAEYDKATSHKRSSFSKKFLSFTNKSSTKRV